MARIILTGYMVRHPVAGNILAFFHYLLGLHRLGHEVMYLEESGWPYSCYDPGTGNWEDHPTTGLRVVRELMDRHGLDGSLCYVNRDTGRVDGLEWEELKRRLGSADLLLNVGGVCWLPEFRLCPRRALVDMDPLFTQVERFGAEILHDYHCHFSYGANIGRPGCQIPTCGIDWKPLPPPVVPELWQLGPAPAGAPFTTIANWGSYGGIEFEGEHYGQKDEEFARLIHLPQHTSVPLELAVSGAGDETMDGLRAHGWSVRDAGREVSTDVETYRSYIAASSGEFSAAKNAYVKTRSGWFSDRSVCYLASGRPVVLQDTGFSDWLPTGEGVVAFSSLDEAASALADVARDYARHARVSRDLAARFFDYRVVLPHLLTTVTGATAAGARSL